MVRVKKNIDGAQIPVNPLMICRTGVCEFRVLLIVRTTWVSAAPSVLVAMWHLKELDLPTELVQIGLLIVPLTGKSLLATGVRPMAEPLETMPLLRLTCLLG